MKIGNIKKEWVTANEAHFMVGVNRAWLREMWDNGDGKIHRRAVQFHGHDGTLYTKFLYKLEDIERVLNRSNPQKEESFDGDVLNNHFSK